MNTLLRNNL